MIEFRQKDYSMKITKAIHAGKLADNKFRQKSLEYASGVLDRIYPGRTITNKAKATARALRIKRVSGAIKRDTINTQNQLINRAAQAKLMVQNIGETSSKIVETAARNPGPAIGTAVNAAGVAILAPTNPAAAAGWQATPFVPAFTAADIALKRKFPSIKRATDSLGDTVKTITRPLNPINFEGLAGAAQVIGGNPNQLALEKSNKMIANVLKSGQEVLVDTGAGLKKFILPRKQKLYSKISGLPKAVRDISYKAMKKKGRASNIEAARKAIKVGRKTEAIQDYMKYTTPGQKIADGIGFVASKPAGALTWAATSISPLPSTALATAAETAARKAKFYRKFTDSIKNKYQGSKVKNTIVTMGDSLSYSLA